MSRLIASLLSAIVLIAPIAAMATDNSGGQEREAKSGHNEETSPATLPWMAGCLGDNGETGTCMKMNDCTSRGGTASGQCANRLGVCCTGSINCGESTRLKRVVLTRTNGVESPCTYTITATSNLVCQLRIDFEQFHLAQPTDASGYMQCDDDSFTVTNGDFKLCGENAGQHIYVPFNSSNGIDLKFTLANRLINGNGLPVPSWKLLVTQLECPWNHKRVQRSLQQEPDNFRKGRSSSHSPRPDIDDSYWVAPHNCLQYFPEPSGVVESFNFNSGDGPYMGDMQYSICFRKTIGDSKLKLFGQTFILPYNPLDNDDLQGIIENQYDNSCLAAIADSEHEDYVLISEGIQQEESVRASRFCGQSIHESTVIASQPGPFEIQFISDKHYVDPDDVDFKGNDREIGFKLNYQIL